MCVFKTTIVNLIQLFLIKTRFNTFVLSLFSTYFLFFLKEDFINCTVNNIIILLLPVKFISVCRIMPAVLSMTTFNTLRTKVSQDLKFLWWMNGAMDETCGFGAIFWMVYISFPELTSDLTHIGVSILQGISSYL